jgi:hypothetical protein
MGSRARDLALRSPYDKMGGLVYFGRMLDKIRSYSRRELPLEYEVNLGKGFDEKCTTFLRVRYELVVEYVNAGLTDEAILQSCFGMGHRPSEAEIYIWNEFMRKRGWHDELSQTLENQKKKEAMLPRSEIQTLFQFIDADEGRLVNDNHVKSCRTRKRIAIPAREWPCGQRVDTAPRPLKAWAHQENNGD